MSFNLPGIYFNKFNNFLNKHLENSIQFVTPFTWIALIGFPTFFILYFETERWWLNTIGFIISLITALAKRSIIFSRKYLSIYWFLCLIYILPFDFIYGYLTNPTNANYQTGMTIMVMGLTIVVSDLLFISIILLLGTLLAVMVAGVTLSKFVFINHLIQHGLIYSYILAITFAFTLMWKKGTTEKLKLEGATTLAHRISHEINTPLAVLTLVGETLKMHMPNLLKTYEIAKQQKLNIPKLQPYTLGMLNDLPNTIYNECNAANAIIDILLMNARDPKKFTQNYKKTSMYDCIEQAILRYNHIDDFDREKINWLSTEDFNFYGIEILMVHVLLNLIKNANRAILQVKKGSIEIFNRKDDKYNYLYFKDTAIGIKKEYAKRLFDSFYTNNLEGTGLGLFFCKNVIEGFHGKIWCESIYQKYTCFIIRLPLYNLAKANGTQRFPNT